MRAYIYCTKAKPMLRIEKEPLFNQKRARTYTYEEVKYFTQYIVEDMYEANGKIVACFDLNKVEKMGLDSNNGLVFNCGFNEESQLSLEEIVNYIGNNYYYSWYIDNLQVFDSPMKLSYFTKKVLALSNEVCDSCCHLEKNPCKNCKWNYDYEQITKAPQSWCYATDINGEACILISIKPEWAEKILNREKIIEVRKTCPREFKEYKNTCCRV